MMHEEISIKIMAAEGGLCIMCVVREHKIKKDAEFGLIISDDRGMIRFQNCNLCDVCTMLTILEALMAGVNSL